MDIFEELKEAAGAAFSLSVNTLLAYCGLTILVYVHLITFVDWKRSQFY